MKSNLLIFTICVTYLGLVHIGLAASVAPLSKYGEIQSVQKYSSNPFWNKDSPYNQRMPTPIYATGADLNTGDCNRVVANLVASFCASNNNCANKKISDVRPTVMVQLSQLPGHNFATSCGGYIDAELEKYKKTYGNTYTNNIVNSGTQQKQSVNLDGVFTKQLSTYEQGVAERTAELKRLQSMTTPTPHVTATDFPTTIDDLSFTDRTANSAAGYEPYKDMKSYKVPKIEEEDEAFFERLKMVNPTEYCRRRPKDCTASNPNDTPNTHNNDDDQDEPCENPGQSADCPIIINLK